MWVGQLDHTPMTTRVRKTFVDQIRRESVTREGGKLSEFLLMRGWLLVPSDRVGQAAMRVLLAEPVPLPNKTTALAFAAYRDFTPWIPALRRIPGITASFHNVDRGLESMYPYLHAWATQKQWETPPAVGRDRLFSPHLHWLKMNACADHDLQNGLVWAVAPAVAEGVEYDRLMKRMFRAVAGVRDGFSDMIEALPFLLSLLAYHDTTGERQGMFCWWTAMGLVGPMAELAADLGIEFYNEQLYINRSWAHVPDLLNTVGVVLMAIMRLHKFTSSRFASVGRSSRPVVAGITVGLDPWVNLAIEHGHKYHLRHWSKFDAHARRLPPPPAISSSKHVYIYI